MEKNKYKILLSVFFIFLFSFGNARESINSGNKKANYKLNKVAASCVPASAKTDLDLNNVRTTILAGGDMWWKLDGDPFYEIPKDSKKHSLFAGALWIGGIDNNNSLKVAAMTYRQSGNDFWPGPLSTATASIDATECAKYDKHWKVTRQEVEDYVNGITTTPSQNIITWPGNGDQGKGQAQFLAPFHDGDGDGVYNPFAVGTDGKPVDYPGYDLSDNTSGSCSDILFGDQTLWWVFNDKGDIHTETGSEPIGMEIHAQAFAFSTNDEINNMTFYKYKVINRSTYTLTNTYFGQWVDADLGKYDDDYVGCDVQRGLGYCYNGDSNDDDPIKGYGTTPPAVGVDFFQGPLADAGDGIDNDRDGQVDEVGEEIIMSKFVYYNNDWSVTGNPEQATHFYNYLQGIWKDNTSMTFGGTGHGGGTETDFMFPGTTDTINFPGQDWTEASVGNTPADRRFLQSAGPFTLQPGAVNYITTGVVWARTSLQNNSLASVDLLKLADDKAQALFDNCFRVLNGPDAPDMAIREMDRELIISLTYDSTSNNYNESYQEADPTIVCAGCDTTYNFQGYQIFQFKDATVSVTDIYDPNKARLVAQCDIKDGIGQIINYDFDPNLGATTPKEMVAGSDEGILHTFRVTDDLFSTSEDKRLVNHKSYYFTVIAYSYNNFKTYNQIDPSSLDGQKKPYFAGRRNIKSYSGIPHIASPENGGQSLGSAYGTGPKITRIEGSGNGGLVLDMTLESINEILNSSTSKIDNPTYEAGKGPVNVKIYDPVMVPKASFRLKFDAADSSANWKLINETTTDTVSSDRNIDIANEQLIPKWGLSVTIEQVKDPGEEVRENSSSDIGFLESTMEYSDLNHQWLYGISDVDGVAYYNWVRSGTNTVPNNSSDPTCDEDMYYTVTQGVPPNQTTSNVFLDPNEEFEAMDIDLPWAPYRLAAFQYCAGSSSVTEGPAWADLAVMSSPTATFSNKIKNLASVNVVITSDKSKWTRCPVIEMSTDNANSEGNAGHFDIRAGASVDKDGNTGDGTVSSDPNDADYISATGMGWFPGYAINMETGERLNMMFGENSSSVGGQNENGRDMIWNPTSTQTDITGGLRFGGKHYIYIMGHNGDDYSGIDIPAYDAGENIKDKLNAGLWEKRYVYMNAMWVCLPMLVPGETLLSSDITIRLRVAKPYKVYNTVSTADTLPQYTFNTEGFHNEMNDIEAAKDALDLINVVPNPYYAYSEYEANQVDNRIKITNLPSKCTISIYTINGTLIRKFIRDVAADNSEGAPSGETNAETSLEWDLKNTTNVPIGSGLYIIHVDAGIVGEKVIKWFGVMRPIDLDTF